MVSKMCAAQCQSILVWRGIDQMDELCLLKMKD